MKAELGRARAGRAVADDGARRRGSKKREREIIDAAAEIFRKRGYAETSVQDVADAVGILKGSLYYYIDSKEDLLYQVLSEVHDDAQVIVEEVSQMDAPPLERLHAYIRRHIAYNTHNLTKIAVFYHDFNLLSKDRREEIVAHRAVYENFIEELIEEAQQRGDVDKSIDVKIAAFYILGAVNWVYTWYDPSGEMSPDELGQLYAELSISGLTGGRVPRRRASKQRRATRTRTG